LADLQQTWVDNKLSIGCSITCSPEELIVAQELADLKLLRITDKWANGEFDIELGGRGWANKA
jgi:hypothetical protein